MTSPRPAGDAASAISALFAGLTALLTVAPHAVRAEIYSLGARHKGEPLSGALAELKSPNLAPGRARLLRAAVRQLRRDQRAKGKT
jgi:hypothetical protein